MNTKQLFITLLALLASMTVDAADYDACVDGIYYDFSGANATVTYKTSSYNSYYGNVVIPETVKYNGVTYNVTKIAYCAFKNCTALSSVTIPQSVSSIDQSAFSRIEYMGKGMVIP